MAQSDTCPGMLTGRQPKRLIFFCDGTKRDGLTGETDRDTNVWRMYRIIENAGRSTDDMEQVLLWQPGVGMEPTETSFLQTAFALGIPQKIRRAYDTLASNYEDGDEIVFIGFSRGAFLVRILAAILGDIGLTTSENADNLFKAYQALPNWHDAKRPFSSSKTKEALRVLEQFRGTEAKPVTIKALCIFDTVGTIGFLPWHTHLPESRFFGFPVESVGTHVERVFHALALDDTRRPFFPTRVELSEEGIEKGQILEQCYFGGWHADVGGGWEDHELASIALVWMAAHLQESAILRFDEASLFQIPGTYRDARKVKILQENGADETLLEQALHSLTRVLPPTKPWGDGLTWPELFPFVNHVPISHRPPMKENDTIHASVHSSATRGEARKKRNPKLHEIVSRMPISQLLPLERRAMALWPRSPPGEGLNFNE